MRLTDSSLLTASSARVLKEAMRQIDFMDDGQLVNICHALGGNHVNARAKIEQTILEALDDAEDEYLGNSNDHTSGQATMNEWRAEVNWQRGGRSGYIDIAVWREFA